MARFKLADNDYPILNITGSVVRSRRIRRTEDGGVTVYETTDGGKTWTLVPKVIDPRRNEHPLHLVDEKK